jgi:mannitol-1-phosphate 5-dehydrogenase
MADHVFVGFGFGPIQAGLFVKEAFQSGNFSRIVVAEIDSELVEAVRANNGSYCINIARPDGLDCVEIKGLEIYNPTVEQDRNELLEALKQSTEIVTALPSTSFYESGENSITSLIAQSLVNSSARGTIAYAAENNNYAAQKLHEQINNHAARKIAHPVQYLNTVIGKMSKVVEDPEEIEKMNLMPVTGGLNRAFLVEQFNDILVDKCKAIDLQPGIKVFIEKENLLPFEEAKLYGHNAVHALLAYLGAYKGYDTIEELKDDSCIMEIAHDAFVNESGAALIRKYSDLNDNLFTESGFEEYARDLLERMTNPYLADTIARAGRDVVRKLGPDDRIFGTMRLALRFGIEPVNMALAGAAGIIALLKNTESNVLPPGLPLNNIEDFKRADIEKLLGRLWDKYEVEHQEVIIGLLEESFLKLRSL